MRGCDEGDYEEVVNQEGCAISIRGDHRVVSRWRHRREIRAGTSDEEDSDTSTQHPANRYNCKCE